ncbi:WD40/YVTN/BNR-like repeat-containing protein [Tenacibaculum amylolyticum]|uniref:WD40/YVTN/BNR-like repeat-containing protein n=1 Tax=Tenacibaculum amylolyticum TaxID=104269 RepID=UPI0038945FF5
MKRFSIIIFSSLIFFSCKKEYKPRSIDSVTIKEFTIDSTSIRAIKVINENTVYYAGSNGKIGTTTNAGETWDIETIHFQDSITPNFRSIAENNGYIYALSIANPALLYKIKGKQNELVYKEIHEKVFYDSMHFFDNKKDGIAVGDPTEDCPSIIITSDGGANWEKIPCSQLPKLVEGEAFFAASNTNIKILGDTVWIATGGTKARVLKSTDKGKTWNTYNTPFIQGDGPQGIYSIDFYDQNTGIAIGGNYAKPEDNCKNKAVTTDGGITWQIVADNENPGYKSCIQYIPNTFGKEVIAVGKTGISFSNDGGNTWKEISTKGFYTIQFVNENIAWLAGNNKIAKMTLP